MKKHVASRTIVESSLYPWDKYLSQPTVLTCQKANKVNLIADLVNHIQNDPFSFPLHSDTEELPICVIRNAKELNSFLRERSLSKDGGDPDSGPGLLSRIVKYGGVIVVDLDQVSVKDMIFFNSILDDILLSLEKEEVPKIRFVGVSSSKWESRYGGDFIRRIPQKVVLDKAVQKSILGCSNAEKSVCERHFKHMDEASYSKALESPHPPTVIDLFFDEDWESVLSEQMISKSDGWHLKDGALKSAILAGKSELYVANLPTTDAARGRLIELFQRGYLWVHIKAADGTLTKQKLPIPPDFKLIMCNVRTDAAKQKCSERINLTRGRFDPLKDTSVQVVNKQTIAGLFEQRSVEPDTGRFICAPGRYSDFVREGKTLLVTSGLSESQWEKLIFDLPEQGMNRIIIRVAPHVKVPERFQFLLEASLSSPLLAPSASAAPSEHVSHSRVIKSSDPDFTASTMAQELKGKHFCLAQPHTKKTIVGTIEKKPGEELGIVTTSEIMLALNAGETIVLSGVTASHYGELEPFLYPNGEIYFNGQPFKNNGKLILVLSDKEPWIDCGNSPCVTPVTVEKVDPSTTSEIDRAIADWQGGASDPVNNEVAKEVAKFVSEVIRELKDIVSQIQQDPKSTKKQKAELKEIGKYPFIRALVKSAFEAKNRGEVVSANVPTNFLKVHLPDRLRHHPLYSQLNVKFKMLIEQFNPTPERDVRLDKVRKIMLPLSSREDVLKQVWAIATCFSGDILLQLKAIAHNSKCSSYEQLVCDFACRVVSEKSYLVEGEDDDAFSAQELKTEKDMCVSLKKFESFEPFFPTLKGQLIEDVLPFLKLHAQKNYRVYLDKKISQIESFLEDPTDRTLVVVGDSGVGKTSLIESMTKRDSGRDPFLGPFTITDVSELSHITALQTWLENGGVLWLDEVNANQSLLGFFRGLQETPPRLIYNGKTYECGNHKLLMTCNWSDWESRYDVPLLNESTTKIFLKGMPDEALIEDVLLPCFSCAADSAYASISASRSSIDVDSVSVADSLTSTEFPLISIKPASDAVEVVSKTKQILVILVDVYHKLLLAPLNLVLTQRHLMAASAELARLSGDACPSFEALRDVITLHFLGDATPAIRTSVALYLDHHYLEYHDTIPPKKILAGSDPDHFVVRTDNYLRQELAIDSVLKAHECREGTPETKKALKRATLFEGNPGTGKTSNTVDILMRRGFSELQFTDNTFTKPDTGTKPDAGGKYFIQVSAPKTQEEACALMDACILHDVVLIVDEVNQYPVFQGVLLAYLSGLHPVTNAKINVGNIRICMTQNPESTTQGRSKTDGALRARVISVQVEDFSRKEQVEILKIHHPFVDDKILSYAVFIHQRIIQYYEEHHLHPAPTSSDLKTLCEKMSGTETSNKEAALSLVMTHYASYLQLEDFALSQEITEIPFPLKPVVEAAHSPRDVELALVTLFKESATFRETQLTMPDSFEKTPLARALWTACTGELEIRPLPEELKEFERYRIHLSLHARFPNVIAKPKPPSFKTPESKSAMTVLGKSSSDPFTLIQNLRLYYTEVLDKKAIADTKALVKTQETSSATSKGLSNSRWRYLLYAVSVPLSPLLIFALPYLLWSRSKSSRQVNPSSAQASAVAASTQPKKELTYSEIVEKHNKKHPKATVHEADGFHDFGKDWHHVLMENGSCVLIYKTGEGNPYPLYQYEVDGKTVLGAVKSPKTLFIANSGNYFQGSTIYFPKESGDSISYSCVNGSIQKGLLPSFNPDPVNQLVCDSFKDKEYSVKEPITYYVPGQNGSFKPAEHSLQGPLYVQALTKSKELVYLPIKVVFNGGEITVNVDFSVASQPAPVASHHAPVASQPVPVASHHAPVASHHAPVASQPAPVASPPEIKITTSEDFKAQEVRSFPTGDHSDKIKASSGKITPSIPGSIIPSILVKTFKHSLSSEGARLPSPALNQVSFEKGKKSHRDLNQFEHSYTLQGDRALVVQLAAEGYVDLGYFPIPVSAYDQVDSVTFKKKDGTSVTVKSSKPNFLTGVTQVLLPEGWNSSDVDSFDASFRVFSNDKHSPEVVAADPESVQSQFFGEQGFYPSLNTELFLKDVTTMLSSSPPTGLKLLDAILAFKKQMDEKQPVSQEAISNLFQSFKDFNYDWCWETVFEGNPLMQLFELKKGNCDITTNCVQFLLIHLFQIPVRETSGFKSRKDGSIHFIGHTQLQVFNGKSWMTVEPTDFLTIPSSVTESIFSPSTQPVQSKKTRIGQSCPGWISASGMPEFYAEHYETKMEEVYGEGGEDYDSGSGTSLRQITVSTTKPKVVLLSLQDIEALSSVPESTFLRNLFEAGFSIGFPIEGDNKRYSLCSSFKDLFLSYNKDPKARVTTESLPPEIHVLRLNQKEFNLHLRQAIENLPDTSLRLRSLLDLDARSIRADSTCLKISAQTTVRDLIQTIRHAGKSGFNTVEIFCATLSKKDWIALAKELSRYPSLTRLKIVVDANSPPISSAFWSNLKLGSLQELTVSLPTDSFFRGKIRKRAVDFLNFLARTKSIVKSDISMTGSAEGLSPKAKTALGKFSANMLFRCFRPGVQCVKFVVPVKIPTDSLETELKKANSSFSQQLRDVCVRDTSETSETSSELPLQAVVNVTTSPLLETFTWNGKDSFKDPVLQANTGCRLFTTHPYCEVLDLTSVPKARLLEALLTRESFDPKIMIARIVKVNFSELDEADQLRFLDLIQPVEGLEITGEPKTGPVSMKIKELRQRLHKKTS